MAKHRITARCEVALLRAERDLVKARAAKDSADAAFEAAEEAVRAARYDLSVNRELDARPTGYNQCAA